MTDPQTGTITPVRASVTVTADQERAFAFFTGRMGAWWNPDFSIGEEPLADVMVEPRVGGAWFEVGSGGARCPWGRVLAWEPSARVLLAWQITAQWAYDPDFETELEITFTPVDGGTRVDLEHSKLERYGDDAPDLLGQYESAGGWIGLLQRFAGAV